MKLLTIMPVYAFSIVLENTVAYGISVCIILSTSPSNDNLCTYIFCCNVCQERIYIAMNFPHTLSDDTTKRPLPLVRRSKMSGLSGLNGWRARARRMWWENTWGVCRCSKSKLVVRESVSFSLRYTWNKCERIFYVQHRDMNKAKQWFWDTIAYIRHSTCTVGAIVTTVSIYSHLKKSTGDETPKTKGKTSHYAECRPLTKCMIDDPKWLYWIMKPRGSCMHLPIDQPRTLILFPFISSTCVIQNVYENIMPFRMI